MDSKEYLEKLKILYVEDDAQTRMDLKNFLKRRVGRVYVAKDGEEGLQKYLEFLPDIVIADLLMPKMNGLEMISKIRKQDCPCDIIITSTVEETNTVLEAVEIGIVKYAIKPINLKALDETLLKIATERYQEQDEVLGFSLEERKKQEAILKKGFTLFLKNFAGKGPKDVTVVIEGEFIEITAFETLTIFEQRLMRNRDHFAIVEQGRICFYRSCKNELKELIKTSLDAEALEIDFKKIESHVVNRTDKLVIHYKKQ